MSLEKTDRENALYALAKQLSFRVDRDGGRFTLTRTIDVSRPVREKNLTLKRKSCWRPGSCAARMAADPTVDRARQSAAKCAAFVASFKSTVGFPP
jgi:hypothetical protein